MLIGYLFENRLLIFTEDSSFFLLRTDAAICEVFWLPKISRQKCLLWFSGQEDKYLSLPLYGSKCLFCLLGLRFCKEISLQTALHSIWCIYQRVKYLEVCSKTRNLINLTGIANVWIFFSIFLQSCNKFGLRNTVPKCIQLTVFCNSINSIICQVSFFTNFFYSFSIYLIDLIVHE